MKKILITLIAITTLLISCQDDCEESKTNVAETTIFMYIPYTPSLNPFLSWNLQDIATSIANTKGLGNDKFVVFYSPSNTTSYLIEYKYNRMRARVDQDTLRTYRNKDLDFTSSHTITTLLNEVKKEANGKNYSMIIGCHAIGWVSKKAWPNINTRAFGGDTEEYQMENTELAKGIEDAGINMKYILFDDCYTANIETVYDLRNVTDIIIGSPTEIMSTGMPYKDIFQYLTDNCDYEKVIDGFYNFFSTYEYPYGTISIIDCSKVEQMASLMKEINSNTTVLSDTGGLQYLDGLSTHVFFDMGDYIKKRCAGNDDLYNKYIGLNRQLVIDSRHTDYFYSSYSNRPSYISSFSGLTISDPSDNTVITEDLKKTNWWKATH